MRKKAENTTKRQSTVRLTGTERLRETLFPAGELRQVLLPMLAGVVTTKKLLRDWVTDFGLAAVVGLMQADAERVVGARKSARLPGRRYSHWGSTPTPFPYDGRQVVLPRPRVRTADKRAELELPLVRQLQGADPMDQRVVEQILLGVSTRGFEQSLGPAPTGVRTRGAKKSRVSEMLVGETTRRMREQFSERLDVLDLVAVMVDGLCLGGHAVVAALGIAREGTKHVLGLRQGSTENKVLCTELLQDLVGRGLRSGTELLFCVDGGKGLRAAINAVFGEKAAVQRCQQHKKRNVVERLPIARQKTVERMLVDAYKSESLKTARRRLQQVLSWLARNGEEDAAASLREGMEETLTVWKLGLPEALRRFFSTTNAIENVMGTIRRVSRNVKRWRHGAMAKRWTALGLRAAQARFKRIKGHRQLPVLVDALKRRAAAAVDHQEALA
jgi:transposase-like protein